ncbi:uncharacterized protein H6S33_004531 [Morchella sextelata]|uniref:uncharacterized protein n=1 Tax=Morchella sextelata TaxID=1174677 RepID=UPI001D0527EA|nr:uncharacterized protein H6S33_004531 [Morchella sextelata]KAH0605309.1 hypothetical protein H6S33_004531 [Morchella sextelata]
MLEHDYDFLFLAEHWYTNHSSRMSNPAVIGTTILPISTISEKKKGRFSGGIYLLASQWWRNKVLKVEGTQHTLIAWLEGVTFAGVYFPPTTMNASDVQIQLAALPVIDILLGDINIRFGDQKKVGPLDKLKVIQDWESVAGLSRMRPDGKALELGTDHAFIKNRLYNQNPQLSLESTAIAGIHTDHKYILKLCLKNYSGSAFKSEHNYHHIYRYRVNKLMKKTPSYSNINITSTDCRLLPSKQKEFSDCYKMIDDLVRLEKDSATDSKDIDLLDVILMTKVQTASEVVLGTISPYQERLCPDKYVKHLVGSNDCGSTVSLFKRLQRCSSKSRIMSSDNNSVTVMHDLENKYSKVYDSQSITRNTYIRHFPSVNDRLYQDYLLRLVTVDKIKEFVAKFSTTKACGEDGIHILQIKNLIETEFITDLSFLYQMCIETFSTPERWNSSILYPLQKNSTKPYTPSNTRPISILVMFRRIFESLILPIFEDSIWDFNQMNPCQGGFRSGYSTQTHALILNHSLASGKRPLTVFLDFEAAFDKVSKELLV